MSWESGSSLEVLALPLICVTAAKSLVLPVPQHTVTQNLASELCCIHPESHSTESILRAKYRGLILSDRAQNAQALKCSAVSHNACALNRKLIGRGKFFVSNK